MKEKISTPKVLMVGPGRNVMGGISTVVNSYYELGLDKKIGLRYISSMEDGSKIKKLAIAFSSYIEFSRHIKECDIVHVHMAAQASFTRKSIFIKKAKKAGKKIIIHQHSADFDDFYFKQCDAKKRKQIKKIFAMADIIIVLSEEWAKFFGENICDLEKIVILYNGVIIPKYCKKDYTDTNVLFLGRLLYLLLLCQDAGLYRNNSTIIRNIIFFVCIIFLMIWKAKIKKKEIVYFSLVALIMVALRFYHHDAQFIDELMKVLEHLLVAYTIFKIDSNKCATRFVRIVTFFSMISLIAYAIANFVPEIYDLPIFTSYKVAWAGSDFIFKGVLFYVYRAFEPFRNNGIFTEPGVYQIVLSAAIFVLLFNGKSLDISKKKKVKYLTILCITMITTTSTTGYISLVALILLGAMQRKTVFPENRIARRILIVGVFIILIDYCVQGTDSFISVYLFDKLNSLTLDGSQITGQSMWTSSGNARMAVYYQMIKVITSKPLGCGFTNFYNLLNVLYGGNAAGARLLIYFAAMGVIPMLLILFPIFNIMWKNKTSVYQFIAYIFIFINTGIAQSKGIYAALAILPLIAVAEKMKSGTKGTPRREHRLMSGDLIQ